VIKSFAKVSPESKAAAMYLLPKLPAYVFGEMVGPDKLIFLLFILVVFLK
jgi:hypothetical protein